MRHSEGGDLGLTLERGNVPNDYFRFCCIRVPSIKVGVGRGVVLLLDSLEGVPAGGEIESWMVVQP